MKHCTSGPPPTPTLPPCRLALWRRPFRAPPFSRPHRTPMPPHAASRHFSTPTGRGSARTEWPCADPRRQTPAAGPGDTPGPRPRRPLAAPPATTQSPWPRQPKLQPPSARHCASYPSAAITLHSPRHDSKYPPTDYGQCYTRLTPGLCPRTLHRHRAIQLRLYANQKKRHDEPNLPGPGVNPHWLTSVSRRYVQADRASPPARVRYPLTPCLTLRSLGATTCRRNSIPPEASPTIIPCSSATAKISPPIWSVKSWGRQEKRTEGLNETSQRQRQNSAHIAPPRISASLRIPAPSPLFGLPRPPPPPPPPCRGAPCGRASPSAQPPSIQSCQHALPRSSPAHSHQSAPAIS